ncbi:hypothetical protein TNCV_2613711 [Trichonephila clavipes]|nr:hypothetical protein TNCV_2613711 [Trichonephila clavipes]
MVLKAMANERRHLVLSHDELRGPRSGLCRSGGISNNNNITLNRSYSHLDFFNATEYVIFEEANIADLFGVFERMALSLYGLGSENASQAAEIVNGVYGADTVTANYVQFWFRRFCSGIFKLPRTSHRKCR